MDSIYPNQKQISIFCLCLAQVLDSIEEVGTVMVEHIHDCNSLLKAYEVGGIAEVQEAFLNMVDVNERTDEVLSLAMTFIDKRISELL
jgi:hypothetical protein